MDVISIFLIYQLLLVQTFPRLHPQNTSVLGSFTASLLNIISILIFCLSPLRLFISSS